MKETASFIIYILIGVLIAGGLIFILQSFTGQESPLLAASAQQASSNQFSKPVQEVSGAFGTPLLTGTTSDGDIAIELTPRLVNSNVEVSITANTHSVDLSQFDLSQIISLELGSISVKPSSAPQLSGHHSSGNLMFNINKNINALTITVTGIPSIEKRVYSWR